MCTEHTNATNYTVVPESISKYSLQFHRGLLYWTPISRIIIVFPLGELSARTVSYILCGLSRLVSPGEPREPTSINLFWTTRGLYIYLNPSLCWPLASWQTGIPALQTHIKSMGERRSLSNANTVLDDARGLLSRVQAFFASCEKKDERLNGYQRDSSSFLHTLRAVLSTLWSLKFAINILTNNSAI